MQNADYSSSPYYNTYPNQNPNPNPNPVESPCHAPPSYASAPPYSSTPYSAPPAPPTPHASGNYALPVYPSLPHATDHVLTAPSAYSQPQSSYSLPQFESNTAYAPRSQTQPQPSYYPTYDHQVNSPSHPNPNPIPTESNYAPHHQQFQLASAGYDLNYDAHDQNLSRARSDLGSHLYGKRDHSGYNNSNYGGDGVYGGNQNFSRGKSDLGSELNGKRNQSGYNYNSNSGGEDLFGDSKYLNWGKSHSGYELYGKGDQIVYNNNNSYGSESIIGDNDGVYAYKGRSEPYGARGTAPKSSTWSGFDDFGRPIGNSSSSTARQGSSLGSGLKVVRAVPKGETQQDAKGGVQKFRVKLLAESAGQDTMDVLCEIALDGIRMLDPSTSRTLRIYLLDTITRCEAVDSSIFAFWSKTPVDIEPRRIRLKSNSYTTSTLLDTVTAAIAQYKEMSARSRPSEHLKVAEQPTEKKKGFVDFMNLIKQINEEKDHWVPDEAISKCTACGTDFSAFVRKHHCRNCGDIFCDKCTQGRTALTAEDKAPVVRVCDRCLGEVTRRLNTAKVGASRSSVVESHEDLAKKLQEEMEKSCKISSGSRSNSSGKRMKEVACPTCTVHLQVQVPSSGSETIECGVCQHPFLVTGY